MSEQQAGGARNAAADLASIEADKDVDLPELGEYITELLSIGSHWIKRATDAEAERQRLAAELAAVQQGQLSSAMFAAIDDSHTIQEQAERIGKLEAELAAVRAERDELLERTESLCEPNRSMVLKGYWVGEPTC